MKNDYIPTIKIIKSESDQDTSTLFINTQSSLNRSPSTKCISVKKFDSCAEINISLDGFNYLEILNDGQKGLTGRVLLKQILNDSVYFHELAKPFYLIKGDLDGLSEPAFVEQLKLSIYESWSKTLSKAIGQIASLEHKKSFEKGEIKSPAKPGEAALNFFQKLKSFNKFWLIGVGFLALVSINAYLLASNFNPPNPTSSQLLNAEQMAAQQDEILNNAFKEIGIDREKLASDMSCFTE